jgi:hypothetical protein
MGGAGGDKPLTIAIGKWHSFGAMGETRINIVDRVEGHGPIVLLAAIAGFLAGGTLTQLIKDSASVLIVLGTIGAFGGAAIAAFLDRDIEKWGAIGGGAGLVMGLVVLALDKIAGG